MTYIVSGSFNPLHIGHTYLIDRVLQQGDQPVVVLQAINQDKSSDFSMSIQDIIKTIYGDKVIYDRLPQHTYLADYVLAKYGKAVHVRGVRNEEDRKYEQMIAQVNHAMGLETMFLDPPYRWSEDYQYYSVVSSSLIRSIVGNGNVGFHWLLRDWMPEASRKALLKNWIETEVSKTAWGYTCDQALALYEEPTRIYHGLDHVAHALEEYKRCVTILGDKFHARLALDILFHDAIYNPQRNDNEERSLDLCRKFWVDWPSRYIMATKDHLNEGYWDADVQLMVACDLAIFGRPQAEYLWYARSIRKEYASVPFDQYCVGRIKVLQGFSSYRFPEWWPDPGYNQRLVENIQGEIGALQKCKGAKHLCSLFSWHIPEKYR